MTTKDERDLIFVPERITLKQLLQQMLEGIVETTILYFRTDQGTELPVCVDKSKGFHGEPPISEGKNGIWKIRGKLCNDAEAPVFIYCCPQSSETVKGKVTILKSTP